MTELPPPVLAAEAAPVPPVAIGAEALKGVTGVAPDESTPEEPWETEVRKKLLSLAGEPLTVQSAGRISEFAKIAGELVAVARNQLPRRKRRQSGWGGLALPDPGEPLDYPGVPIGVNNKAETFGAKVLREVLAAIPKIQRKGNPAATVRAIAEAKKAGLDDLAKKLTDELLLDDQTEIVERMHEAGLAARISDKADTGPQPDGALVIGVGLDGSIDCGEYGEVTTHEGKVYTGWIRSKEGATIVETEDREVVIPNASVKATRVFEPPEAEEPPVDVVEFPAPGDVAQAQAHVAEYKEALQDLPEDIPPGVQPAFQHADGSVTLPHGPPLGGATTLSPELAQGMLEEGVEL